ncbi:8-amino-7-oxononanoate synthase [Chitinophagaceae bacterium LB-8]|uniref:8-amino-7-oxononanoate synthase n=1 Tax=Paraflavisolibacter caeni TaxID=2982496 RepID=A0A9X3B750_9BACT|nr:8-amino-7-oxononanoate synthase [Paraflavisolibacter caeni]MCU7548106.1 8-amino-7-oxononanoate synthase [Paraflavisolibacter caeni]
MIHTHLIDEYLSQSLQKREQEGLLRQLACNEGLIDFCSNDYLGLAQSNLLSLDGTGSQEEMASGSTGSRLVSGNSPLAEKTERIVAGFHHAEAALLFNTGYMANLGLCSCIADKHSVFIYDEHIHASIIDGMRLSLAKRFKFKHNDVDDLRKKLKQAEGKVYVVIESLYSMDGDLAPLQEISDVCKEHKAALIVDEAHAVGIYGDQGRGLVCHHQLENDVWARIITFGKALGCHGAAVVGSSLLRDYLINHARSFIYTTAMPPHAFIVIQRSYQEMAVAQREKLFGLIHHFQKVARETSIEDVRFLLNPSPIQGVIVPGNERVKRLAEYVRQQGFFMKAILSPTVPAGSERLRICLHAFNSCRQIDQLLTAIKLFLT